MFLETGGGVEHPKVETSRAIRARGANRETRDRNIVGSYYEMNV
jgi:hypothetical protein